MAAVSHTQRVTRLYRRSMKHLLSWCVEREVWRKEALKLRAEFDAFKHVTDRNKIAQLVEDGEERFRRQCHPEPYIHPLSPEGGKWERNMPPPKHIPQFHWMIVTLATMSSIHELPYEMQNILEKRYVKSTSLIMTPDEEEWFKASERWAGGKA